METNAIPSPNSEAVERPLAGKLPSRGRFFSRRPVRVSCIALGSLVLIAAVLFSWRYVQFRTHLTEARTASSEGRIGAALSGLDSCAGIDPDNREALLLAARIFRLNQDWANADAALERYWTLCGDDDNSTLERLLLRAARDDTEPVFEALKMRIASGGDPARQCRHALVAGFIREFRYSAAQEMLDAWQSETPNDPLAGMLLGRLEERRSNAGGAIDAYTAILERYPNHHEARLKLVLQLMPQRRADAALPHLNLLKVALPDNPDVAVQRALALRQLGRTEEATNALDEALVKHPNSTAALAERGTLALNEGNDLLAAEFFERAMQSDPGSIGTRNLYIVALTRLGRTDDAARETERVKSLMADSDRLEVLINGPLQTRPNDPSVPAEIAGIALRAGQVSEAIRWYQTALKRNPNHKPSHTALSVIYHELDDPVLATKHRALAATGGDRR